MLMVGTPLLQLVNEYDLVDDFGGDFADWDEQYASLPPPDDAIYLHVPAGHYGSAASTILAYGNRSAVIRGEGIDVTFLKIVFSGPAAFEGWIPPNLPIPRFDGTAAGPTTITLVDPVTYANIFVVGRVCCIMGWCMQVGGYPPNNHFFEFKRITDIDTDTGVITLDSPLAYAYSDDWPEIVVGNGSSSDTGGTPTIFPLNSTASSISWPLDPDRQHFDQRLVIKDLTIENGPGESWFGCSREIRWERVRFSGFSGTASVGERVTYEGCLFNGSSIEIDKEVTLLEFRNTDFDGCGVNNQSSSIETLIMENCASLTAGGAFTGAKNSEFINCDLYRWRTGPGAYGWGESHIMTDCNCQEQFTDLFYRHIEQSVATSIVAGVITYTRSNFINSDALLNFTPGMICMLSTTQDIYLRCFNVLSIEDTGANVIITTDLPGSIPENAIATRFTVGGPRYMTVSGCTGAVGSYNGHANQVGFTHMQQTVNGSGDLQVGAGHPLNNKFAGYEFICYGTIISVTINVVQAYTGVQPTLTVCPFSDGGVNMLFAADHTTLAFWNPQVNCKIAGTRVITPGSTSGTQSGDTNITLAAGNNWIPRGGQICFSTDVSGESSGVRPIVTITIETNQGI